MPLHQFWAHLVKYVSYLFEQSDQLETVERKDSFHTSLIFFCTCHISIEPSFFKQVFF